ncbi:MAG: FtsW/RodA/SpoVE family cell cycle protein [Chloroflexi bacterium]|nr:FtsW/RodA/SpoVE family cell cycle protein [Chloroflexota bacterium]
MGRGWRLVELSLLVYPVGLLAVAFATLNIVRGTFWETSDVRIVVLFGALLLLLHVFLSARLGAADQALLPIVGMLVALGLIAVNRLEPSLAPRQALWIVLGCAALVGTALVLPRIDWLARYRYTWASAGILLLLATMVFGVDPNASGTRLWLGFGGLYFQPSEIMKVVMVTFFASYLAEKGVLISHAPLRIGRVVLPPLPYLAPLAAMWALSMALLIWQRDLGAALLFYLVFLALLYAGTGRPYVGVGLIFLIVGAIVAYTLFDHVQLRARIWLDPWPEAQEAAYQIVQGLTAFAAGGIMGSGLGYGYAEYVPAVHTDFVLAALGEELGLIGTLAVVALYLALMHRAFRIALRAPSTFAMLLAAGLGATLGLQAIIILGGNLRLIPITGITLPFLSYGGSSILVNFIMVGLLLRVSAESPSSGGNRA